MKMNLGNPGEGFHVHVFGVAIFDVLGTLVLALLLARWRRWPFLPTAFAVFLVGIVAHRVFGVRTVVDRALYPHVLNNVPIQY